MTYKEYYGFPEGTNVQYRHPINLILDTFGPNDPCPPVLGYACTHILINNRPSIRFPDTSVVRDMNNMFYASLFTTVPLFDTSNVTDMGWMFGECNQLTSVPAFNTSNVTVMDRMFQNCKALTSVPAFNTSNVTTMQRMFYYCSKLTSVPHFDTSNVTNMDSMFYNCSLLKTIPPFNTSKVTTMSSMLSSCYALESLPALDCGAISYTNYYPLQSYGNNFDKLTDVGGFLNMKFSWNDTYGLQKCPNLTRESCINILNGLYDFSGNGETPAYNQGVLKVHANFLTAVGDDISIGTSKGWTITA